MDRDLFSLFAVGIPTAILLLLGHFLLLRANSKSLNSLTEKEKRSLRNQRNIAVVTAILGIIALLLFPTPVVSIFLFGLGYLLLGFLHRNDSVAYYYGIYSVARGNWARYEHASEFCTGIIALFLSLTIMFNIPWVHNFVGLLK